ncbi:hypothetical protein JTB14_032998 [Gonioctena quinquepunctata]|nr:hypothetical protein JTB14_032998 [Gonioctena quinquepunctata]
MINKFPLLDAYPLPKIKEIVQKVSKHEIYSSIDLKSTYQQIPIPLEDRAYTAFEEGGKLYQFTRIPFGFTNRVFPFQRRIYDIIEWENLISTYAYLDDVTICGRNQVDHNDNLKKIIVIIDKYHLTINKDKYIFSVDTINIFGYTSWGRTIKPDPNRLQSLLDMPLPLIICFELLECFPTVPNAFHNFQKKFNHWYEQMFFP